MFNFSFNKQTHLIILIILGVLLFVGGVKYTQERLKDTPTILSSQPLSDNRSEDDQTLSNTAPPGEIVVHVAGAVTKPGVYRLPGTARVIDAVTQAKPLPTADLDQLNLAANLSDGQKVTVLQKGETVAGVTDNNITAPIMGNSIKVNINTASLQELETLPGIGAGLASRIVQYRENNGSFRVIEDITNVSGIGEGRYNQIKDLITTN